MTDPEWEENADLDRTFEVVVRRSKDTPTWGEPGWAMKTVDGYGYIAETYDDDEYWRVRIVVAPPKPWQPFEAPKPRRWWQLLKRK